MRRGLVPIAECLGGVGGLVIPGLLLLLLTVPRMALNYGADGDAIRNIVGAEQYARTGAYWPVRLPGSPLFDLMLAVVDPWGGPVATNALVLGFYLASVALFWRLCRDQPHGRLLTGLFAATPLLLKNAVTTMDYVPGLALLLASYLALRERRVLLAGALLGCAAGMRVTHLVFVVPAVLYLLRRDGSFRAAFVFAAVSGLLASGFNWPLLAQLAASDGGLAVQQKPPLLRLLQTGHNGVSVWGPVATLAIVLAGLANLKRLKALGGEKGFPDPDLLLAAGSVVLFTGAFVLLPDEPEYLLPAVPFVYLLLARFVPRPHLLALGVLVFAAGLVSFDMKGGRCGERTFQFKPAPGMLIQDHRDRREWEALRAGLGALPCTGKAVVLAGTDLPLTHRNPRVESVPLERYPELREVLRYGPGDPPFHRVEGTLCKLVGREVFLLTSAPKRIVEDLRRRGYEVCYFPRLAAGYALHLHGYDPAALGLRALEVRGEGAFYRSLPPAAPSASSPR